MIKKCDLVTLINASTGLEALFFKKPVIVFTDVFYSLVSMVTKISDFNDLSKSIRDSLTNFCFNSNELSFLINSIENKQTLMPYFDILSEAVSICRLLSQ